MEWREVEYDKLINMKTLKCDLCDHTAKGNTFEEWMMNLMPHYMEAHAEVMQPDATKSEEEQQAMKQKWMEENKIRFDAQPDDVEVTA